MPGAAGLLPARVYHPDPSRRLPLLVYVHGGGFVLGSVNVADAPCRRLAVAAGDQAAAARGVSGPALRRRRTNPS